MRKHSIKRIVEVEFLNDNTLNPLLVKSCHKCKGLILIAHEAKNLFKNAGCTISELVSGWLDELAFFFKWV